MLEPECIERLTEDALANLQFVTKLDSPNGELALMTARTTSLLVELLGVEAYLFVGWMCESGRDGEFQEAMGNLEYGYSVSTDFIIQISLAFWEHPL